MVLTFGTPPFPEPTTVTLEPIPLAMVRHDSVTVAQMGSIYDTTFGVLARAVADGVLIPAGGAIGAYYGDPSATFDLEIGFPLAAALSEPIVQDDIVVAPSTSPVGNALILSHIGGFDGLPGAWARLMAAVPAERAGAQPLLEIYVSDPSQTPTEQLRTDLLVPLA